MPKLRVSPSTYLTEYIPNRVHNRGFREVFARFSRGFREVFARFSRGFRFQNIFVKGSGEQKKKSIFACRGGPRGSRKKNNFCVPRGPPPRGAAEPGPPRHAKIGKNGSQKRPGPVAGQNIPCWSKYKNFPIWGKFLCYVRDFKPAQLQPLRVTHPLQKRWPQHFRGVSL